MACSPDHVFVACGEDIEAYTGLEQLPASRSPGPVLGKVHQGGREGIRCTDDFRFASDRFLAKDAVSLPKLKRIFSICLGMRWIVWELVGSSLAQQGPCPILYRLGNMLSPNHFTCGQIRNGATDF